MDKVKFYNRDSINLDITNRCALECPRCIRSTYKEMGKKVPGYDMPTKHFEMLLKNFNHFIFCGNISDPIFHPDFLDMLQKLNDHKKIASVHTAASQKSLQWYENAFRIFPNATWHFGIDGLPKDSNKYRINQDGEKLFDIMLIANKILKKTIWQYIVFKYNENHIDEAKKLADKNNIELKIVFSSRFLTKDIYKPTNSQYYCERA